MPWKKINSAVSMWEKPALGTINQKDGKRFMALCIDPSSKKPYRGIAREVVERSGNIDILGYVDKSKLVIIESSDLLKWKIVRDVTINKLDDVIKRILDYQEEEKYFVGLEDPDILVDKKGIKHVYFTLPFKYKNKEGYDVHVGHAKGNSLNNLIAMPPVLNIVNEKIRGFKEICPLPQDKKRKKMVLAETFVGEGKESYCGISISEMKGFSKGWRYIKMVHNPQNEKKLWCSGDSSPCRIFDPKILTHKGYLVGIMNGAEPDNVISGKRYRGKFVPGLFLFDNEKKKVVWTAENPLIEDPKATKITFASELITLNKKEALLYAHPNDSFVRVYKLNLDEIRKMLPNNI